MTIADYNNLVKLRRENQEEIENLVMDLFRRNLKLEQENQKLTQQVNILNEYCDLLKKQKILTK